MSTGVGDETTSGLPKNVRKLKRGQSLEEAIIVFSCKENDLYVRGWSVNGKQTSFHAFLNQHSMQESTLTIDKNGEQETIKLPRAANKTILNDYVIWQPNGLSDEQQGFVFMRPLDYSESGHVLFQPTTNSAVTRILSTRDCVVLIGCDGTTPWLRAIDLRKPRKLIHHIPLPRKISHIDVSWFASDPDNPGYDESNPRLNIVAQSLLIPPRLIRIDPRDPLATSAKHLVSETPSFNASGMREALFYATSDDGTKIPYRIALPRIAKNGPVPVVFTAYGGFGLTADAGYLRLLGPMLLEHGIGCGVAHIRGGGEFGPAWHRSGAGVNKPNAFIDCAAVSKELVLSGIAAHGRVGFFGGSHGGLIGAVMATQYPELFGAISIDSPVTDLLNYHRSTIGAAWVDEFGNPENPLDLARLERWSPIHNIRQASNLIYPIVHINVATNDDRVDPLHGLRFATALRSANQKVLLTLNDIGGHHGTGILDDIAEDCALLTSFFHHNLGK